MALQGHTERAMHAEFSFDDTLLLTAAQDNKARVWDAQTGALLQVLDVPKIMTAALAH